MALTIFLIFVALAVVGRVAMQYRISGDHGIRPVGTASPTVAVVSSILLLLSFMSVFTLITLDAVGMIKPSIEHSHPITIAGIVVSVSGITLTVMSQYQMGVAWRIGVDDKEKTGLVTKGIYSRIRNPIYSGVFLFGIGILILLPSIYMLISLAIGYLSIEIQVRFVEEPHLLRLHGEVFEKYRGKSGRYFPKLNHGK